MLDFYKKCLESAESEIRKPLGRPRRSVPFGVERDSQKVAR